MDLLNKILDSPSLVFMFTALAMMLSFLLAVAILVAVFRNREWVKFLIRLPKEFLLIYSDGPSLFGKKRVHEGAAFWLVMFVNAGFLYHWRNSLSFEQFMIWTIAMLAGIGWNIGQIQKEKITDASKSAATDASAGSATS